MSVHQPDRGQIVVLNFDPQAGAEIGKRRPCLVITPRSYNRLTGQVLVCPITSKPRGNPFEVPLTSPGKTVGAVLSDRLRSFDWKARQCALVEKAPVAVLEETLARLRALIDAG